ncbi:AraC family transcriptional regulator [Gallaecimonas mangrovi]|uniref:AraC family transcriptional regulator n=1 Tax=Gallaecimonas mangrovi TaxID=2291597 RepID=UPI000E204198|nr:AraC family transcriptional regulator [Gallaecimonas mangrovi]
MATTSLVQLLTELIESDGESSSPVPGVRLHRYQQKTPPFPCMFLFGIGITVQGGKSLMVGREHFQVSAGTMVITNADLPITNQVTEASIQTPFLGVWLELDVLLLTQLATQLPMNLTPAGGCRCMRVFSGDSDIEAALVRLLSLPKQPALVAQLAPLIHQEIMVRLLCGPGGAMLRELVSLGSPVQRVAKVIAWMKAHFAENTAVDDLAAMANMSPSSFRQHFRNVTGTSPLQYIKEVRLIEARQLMLNEAMDAGSAALRVGYESASQFSREYARFFGAPPRRDTCQLRQGVVR